MPNATKKVSTCRRAAGPVQKRCNMLKMTKSSTSRLRVKDAVKKKTTMTARKLTVTEQRTRTLNLTVKPKNKTKSSSSSSNAPKPAKKRNPSKTKTTTNNYLSITGVFKGVGNSMFG